MKAKRGRSSRAELHHASRTRSMLHPKGVTRGVFLLLMASRQPWWTGLSISNEV